jgi:hypothetical protein
MADRSWMSFIMPLGKYKGDTLGMVKIKDPGYLRWLVDNIPWSNSMNAALSKAYEYLQETDPGFFDKETE